MVFTEEEETIIRAGINLYKKRKLLDVLQIERNVYNVDSIDTLKLEIKAIESSMTTFIEESAK